MVEMLPSIFQITNSEWPHLAHFKAFMTAVSTCFLCARDSTPYVRSLRTQPSPGINNHLIFHKNHFGNIAELGPDRAPRTIRKHAPSITWRSAEVSSPLDEAVWQSALDPERSTICCANGFTALNFKVPLLPLSFLLSRLIPPQHFEGNKERSSFP